MGTWLRYITLFSYLFYITCQDEVRNNFVLYADISLANRSESLEKIKLIPVKMFEFKYDKIAGRKQMGVLAADAHRLFPDSVEVVPQHSVPGKEKNTFITLLNFPIVDKSVIFTHGLVALQELLEQYNFMRERFDESLTRQRYLEALFSELEGRLNETVSARNTHKRTLLEMESQVQENRRQQEIRNVEAEKESMDEHLLSERAMMQYEEELARSRLSLQETFVREGMAASVQLERDLAQQREALRRSNSELIAAKNAEYGRELDTRKATFEIEKIKAEVSAKAMQERANEDVAIRKLQEQAKLDTQKMVEGVRVISEQLANMAQQFLSKPHQIAAVLGVVVAVLASYQIFYQFIIIVRSLIQSRLGRPSLVRETSYSWSIIPPSVRRLLSAMLSTRGKRGFTDQDLIQVQSYFSDVILEDEGRDRVFQLALSTRNTKHSGAPYRHVLLHGPPGTGKTLIARQLAKSSNMDYAIMSGGDVGPLGEQAVDQLHALFHWASRSQRGLLLFIDEAEAFLSARRSAAGSSGGDGDAFVRHALNALLYQTGTQSKSLMLVLATNRPEDLDPAILDRIDLSMYIGLPAEAERLSLIKLYMTIHVTTPAQESQNNWKSWLGWSRKKYVSEECLSDGTIANIAAKCRGFSGREISKLFISVHYAMLLAHEQTLSKSLLLTAVDSKVSEHKVKMGFAGLPDASEKSTYSKL